MLSLVCCLDAFKRSQLEDMGDGESSEPPTSGIGPKGAVAALNLEEMNNQKGRTDRWASPAPSWVPPSLGLRPRGAGGFQGDGPPRAPSICVPGSGATGRGRGGGAHHLVAYLWVLTAFSSVATWIWRLARAPT